MAKANIFERYLNWLHLQWPAGEVERLPDVGKDGITNIPGVYIAGDLTGIPLLKFSAHSGTRAVKAMLKEGDFQKAEKRDPNCLDLLIIGAGVAGMAAALEAKKNDLNVVILESATAFSTLLNFPKGKPIFTYPTEMVPEGDLQFRADIREGLLEEVQAQTQSIDVKNGRATSVQRSGNALEVHLQEGSPLIARRVLIAIGRSGDYRRLGVPGEDLAIVSNRLHDPKTHKGQRVVVVGGGDSAVEAAIALHQAGAEEVVLSYRKASLNRPKPANVEAISALSASSKINQKNQLRLALGTTVEAITDSGLILNHKDDKEAETIQADAIYSLIGREAPLDFFRRSGIQISGEWTRKSMVVFALFFIFCFALYNWKSGGQLATLNANAGAFPYSLNRGVTDLEQLPDGVTFQGSDIAVRKPWAYLQPLPQDKVLAAFEAKERLESGNFTTDWDEKGHLNRQIKAGELFLPAPEGTTKNDLNAIDRTTLLGTLAISSAGPSFWYTLAYVFLVCIFGYRRIRRQKTPYVTVQTVTLAMVQALPLFLLPEILLPLMGYHGILPAGLADALFPAVDYGHGREYWRAYGLILAWPLNVYNWQTDQPLYAWLAIGGFQTFVLIPALVWRYGKGAYCGWICSCGALAETLGDEHRKKMPHGEKWNRLNVLGQIILFAAAAMMVLRIATWVFPNAGLLKTFVIAGKDGYGATGLLAPLQWLNYKWIVDVFLAGVLGYGLYFWMSGRTWCRFACPLAALMHIYARFSRFRIFADKKKCISCNVCTSMCHQGIDIMSVANKGLNMQDPECVRCSACVSNCPTGVLAFGRVDKSGNPEKLDGLIASPVHAREGLPNLVDLGRDAHG